MGHRTFQAPVWIYFLQKKCPETVRRGWGNLKGDDSWFSKCCHEIFWLYSFNNYILCWIMAYNVNCMPWPIYFNIWVKIWPKIERNGMCAFRKWNSFNNWRKDRKCGIDLVDSMFNTLHWDLRIGKCVCYLLPHENLAIPSEVQILNNYVWSRCEIY